MRPLIASALLATGCLLFPVDDVVPTKHPECEDLHPDAVNVAKWKTRTVLVPLEDAGDACTVEECRGTFVDANKDPADGCEKDGAAVRGTRRNVLRIRYTKRATRCQGKST